MNVSLKHYPKWKKSNTKDTYCMIPLIWKPGIDNSTDRERRLLVSRDWGEDRMGSDCLMVMRFSSGMKTWKYFECFWVSSQDGGIGRYTLLPRTTKRRITNNLKTKNNQNCQKMELYRNLTTKELKKKHSSRQVRGAEMGNQGGEDPWQGTGARPGKWGGS